jgi:hypothetical protein
MKIQTHDTTLVYDLVNHMREKGMPDYMSGYLRFLLEDNIPMHIKIDGKLYSAPWRYWNAYVNAFASCCGCCNEDSIAEVDMAREELLKHAVQLKDGALDY